MSTCSLTLYPYGKQPFSVGLSENNSQKDPIQPILTEESDVSVFSDLSYEFALSCGKTGPIRDIDVYINDILEPSIYNNGRILFPNKNTNDRRIFIDCYGFVKITLVVHHIDDTEHQYSTAYLPVLVRRGKLNDAVKAMVSYVDYIR